MSLYSKFKDLVRNPIRAKLVISKHIKNISFKTREKPVLIICFDGFKAHGGLVDRLKGIMSFYETAMQAGIDFKIYHKVPYELTHFLIPHQYDWIATEEDMKWNPFSTKFLYAIQDFEMHPLKKVKRGFCKTFFVYNNVDFFNKLLPDKSDEERKAHWSLRFKQLFKMSPFLQEAINNLNMPEKTLAIHTRFISIVGDFVDNTPLGVLSNQERNQLFDDLVKAIEKSKENYTDGQVFIFSDSITYLNFIKENTSYQVLKGIPLHPDNWSHKYELEQHLKTFLDFFAIAKCTDIILIRRSFMHPSAYPLYASYINNAIFKEIII